MRVIQYIDTASMRVSDTVYGYEPSYISQRNYYRKGREVGLFLRAILWFLGKLRVYSSEKMIAHHVWRTLDIGEATDKILDEIKYCSKSIEVIYDKKCSRLVVGPRQAGILNEATFRHVVEFTCDIHLAGRSGARLFGMTVQIVPWVDGVILLP